MFGLVLAVSNIVTLNPNDGKNQIPGTAIAQQWVNGVGFYGLAFTLVGVVLSAGLWAVGAFSNNYTQSVNGKKGFLICAGAALAIGAAQYLVGYFYDKGTEVKSGGA